MQTCLAPQTGNPLRSPGWVRVRSFIAAVTDRRWTLSFVPECSRTYDALPCERRSITLLLGDDGEWNGAGEPTFMGNAASACFDGTEGSVEVRSSISGLPAVFLGRFPGRIVLTSDLSLLAAPGGSLRFDPAAVEELFQVAYPTCHRTLFRDVSLIPGGHLVRVDANGRVSSTRSWTLPEPGQHVDWPSYVDFQVETFRAAVRAIDLSGTFLSLTGGLDTRAILASLVADGRRLPAATLTGPSMSVDARLARALSEAYGLPHHVVRLDADFLRHLPTYVVEASRLSGGLASLEEAGEVYFYRQLAEVGTRRLSGHLGNHVGRRGFERLSPRRADLSILAEDFVAAGASGRRRNVLLAGGERWRSAIQRSVQEDGTLPLVANASIGQHFATQQSPYASRAMIESLARSPLGREAMPSLSVARARWRDLRHRVLGEAKDRSFQRVLVARGGGYAASCPINWGWLAGGGVSIGGLAMGALAFGDVVASWPNPASRGLSKILRLTGTAGAHEIKPFRAWLTAWLRDFVHDTLRSQTTRESGLFDAPRLAGVLREHYSAGRDRTETITAALDLALANQLFRPV